MQLSYARLETFKRSFAHKGIFCALPNCSIPNQKFYTANVLQIHISKCYHYVHPDIVEENVITLSDTIPVQQTLECSDIKPLAKLYLDLSANHFATESVLQPMIAGNTKIFENCTKSFSSEIKDNDDFSHDQRVGMLKIFQSNFRGIIVAHNSEYGVLRTTYTRKEYYKNNFNYVAPE